MKSRRPLPIARSPLRRSTKPIRKRSRSKAEFARIYGSKARVKWVKSLACGCCGRTGYTENAHIETGGIGRKADYTKIAPLCGRLAPWFSCHARLHDHGVEDLTLYWGVNLGKLAAETEAAWASSVLEDTET